MGGPRLWQCAQRDRGVGELGAETPANGACEVILIIESHNAQQHPDLIDQMFRRRAKVFHEQLGGSDNWLSKSSTAQRRTVPGPISPGRDDADEISVEERVRQSVAGVLLTRGDHQRRSRNTRVQKVAEAVAEKVEGARSTGSLGVAIGHGNRTRSISH
jgi:hypothetical protein